MGTTLARDSICGEWIGLLSVSAGGLETLQNVLGDLSKKDDFGKMRMAELFRELIKRGHEMKVLYILGHWLDVDDIMDLSEASVF